MREAAPSKHTPGPWQWSAAYETGDGRETWSLIGRGGYGILSCDGVGNAPQGLGDEANARLIAAAPELLEALKPLAAIADWYDAHKKVSDDYEIQRFREEMWTPVQVALTVGHCRTARAAIAKAEGK